MEGDLTLTNNLITGPVDNSPINKPAGINVGDGSGLVASINDVYFAPFPNYSGIADPTGTDGNLSVDPKYFNAANLQYNLRGGSPVIDAGTSDAAPANDYFGNPRFDDPNVPNRGGGAMPYVDMGAIERQETSTSDVDLAIDKCRRAQQRPCKMKRSRSLGPGRNYGIAAGIGPMAQTRSIYRPTRSGHRMTFSWVKSTFPVSVPVRPWAGSGDGHAARRHAR